MQTSYFANWINTAEMADIFYTLIAGNKQKRIKGSWLIN